MITAGLTNCSDRMKTKNKKETIKSASADTSKTSGYFYHQPPQGQ
jgi:hypothetical protein